MRGESVTLTKCKKFAIRIVRLYQFLTGEKKEYVLSNQILRSGTSIGANFAEALYGISSKDFLAKAYISLKECAETKYWLQLLYEGDYLTEREYSSIDYDCTELLRLLTAITKTLSMKVKNTTN